MRTFGLSLDEIAAALETPASMTVLLHAHLAALARRAGEIEALRTQLTRLLDHDDPSDYLKALEMMAMLDSYFTPEQQDSLAARREELGPEAIETAKSEWLTLVESLLVCVRTGTAPDSQEARDLVTRWDALGAGFHAGGTGTETAARQMWADKSEEISARLPWTADELRALVTYVNEVRTHRD
ncbi:hypothetical protein HerbRD11066_71540 [Herbidospora sp. RD11066]